MDQSNTILDVQHASKLFPLKLGQYTRAVNDVTFKVNRGEVFGIVGESGCGKTTTGRCIIGLHELSGGDIFYDGKRINTGVMLKKKEIKRLRREGHADEARRLAEELKLAQHEVKENRKAGSLNDIQMIFQDPVSSLDPRMTVREIIAEGLIIQGVKDKNYIDQQVYDALEYVRLVKDHANRYPHEFSGGQRQRIGIARALVMKAKVLIADEPVSALDVSIQAQVINLLDQLREEQGMTILFIAHDLSVVKYFSDRIAVMYFGNMVELASSDDLFAHPFHPYTQSLLSSIPVPDPRSERKRKRIPYVPELVHDYSVDKPSLHEIRPNHWVRCNEAELQRYRAHADDLPIR